MCSALQRGCEMKSVKWETYIKLRRDRDRLATLYEDAIATLQSIQSSVEDVLGPRPLEKYIDDGLK
jgi:hypothetical protein